MKKIISIIILTITFIACSNKEIPEEIKINGKVFTPNVTEVKLTLYENNIAITPIDYFAKIEQDSLFTFSISSKHSLSGSIHCGNYFHQVYLMPGDDLFVEIDGDTIKYLGQGSDRNNFLYEIVEKQQLNSYFALTRETDDMNELANLLKSKRDNFLTALNSYSAKNFLEPEFINNYKIFNKSALESVLIIYPNMSGKRSDNNLPEMFSSIKLINNFVDDSKLVSQQYYSNMNNYLFTKALTLRKGRKTNFDSLKQIILFDSLSGKSKVFTIANYLVSLFNYNEYDTVVYNRFKEEIKDSYAQELVNNSYEKYIAKQKLLDAPLNKEFNLTLLEDDKGKQLTFADMVEKYKGKLIYLDFWSLGCGPCRASMPKSKEHKENLKNYPIEFVYLTTDRKYDKLWEDVYKVSLTNENHYRLVKGFDARLLKYMKINWVPNYMLIDKDSKLLSFKAVRPTSPKFKEEIMKYIN